MKLTKMKLATVFLMATVAITGCKTKPVTPYPEKVSFTAIGMGYKCDRKELRKKGSDLDISTMVESVRYAYHDFNDMKLRCKYRIIQDDKATVDNVKLALTQAMYDDLSIIYFSCKATQIKATADTEEADGFDECLMLYDGLLIDNDIWNILKTAKGRVFIIFDTSNSETMFKANSNTVTNESLLIDLYEEMKTSEDKTNDVIANLNMVCWSACLDNETIKEREIGSKLTNTFYFKFSNDYLSYNDVFTKLQKTLDNKQNIKKTVIGKDFSDNSMFR